MNLDENLENAKLEPNQPTRREWGSIRQRGSNSWEIRYPTLRSSGIPGKHSYETVQGSREDAEKVLERRHADYDWKKRCIEDEQERIIVATTKDGEGSRTVDDIWTHSYLPYARERIEEGSMQKSTLHGYKHYYTLHVGPVFGHRPIGSILHSEVQRYYKTLTNPQAKHTLAIMRILWNFACTEEGGHALLKSHNIMLESFKMPPASKKKIKVVSSIYDKEELQEVLEAIEGDPIEPYILLMGGGGARPGEACGVWKQEIQFDYHNHPLSGEGQFWAVVPLNRTVGRVDGEIIIKSTLKTETSRRSLFIPEPYSIRLKELVDTSTTQKYFAEDYDEIPLTPDRLSWMWRGMFKGLPYVYIPIKNLRNSYGSIMLASGYSEELVRKLLGHSSLEMLHKHYDRRTDEMLLSQLMLNPTNPASEIEPVTPSAQAGNVVQPVQPVQSVQPIPPTQSNQPQVANQYSQQVGQPDLMTSLLTNLIGLLATQQPVQQSQLNQSFQ